MFAIVIVYAKGMISCDAAQMINCLWGLPRDSVVRLSEWLA